ncbi:MULTISPECIES: class I SAM-dependent methyltransferase [unclassified Psychrobacter]|uniref:hypothetical protein n=1 Tax=unclassified Psychrobacter TaxID=196806 RepID=UPI003FD09117
MNPYERYVLPKLIDIACSTGNVMKARASLVPQAVGEVLEVGLGSGLNLAFYDPEKVSSIVGVDPAAQMQPLARTQLTSVSLSRY